MNPNTKIILIIIATFIALLLTRFAFGKIVVFCIQLGLAFWLGQGYIFQKNTSATPPSIIFRGIKQGLIAFVVIVDIILALLFMLAFSLFNLVMASFWSELYADITKGFNQHIQEWTHGFLSDVSGVVLIVFVFLIVFKIIKIAIIIGAYYLGQYWAQYNLPPQTDNTKS